jgi:hypothetical protein
VRETTITAFTIPRGFTGDVARRQRNSLRALRAQGLDVILFGDEEGVAEAAAEHAARHVPEIALSELGTPLVGDAFARAAELASTPVLLYTNADIVFLPGLVEAAARLGERPYLGLGRRWELELGRELELGPGWAERLAVEAKGRGRLGSVRAIDWFLFPRALRLGHPPFVVGRPGWDNWTIARARALGVPVVDLTGAVTVVHEPHDYAHVPGSRVRWKQGPETELNARLAAELPGLGILDASHVLGRRGLRPAWEPRYLRRRLGAVRDRGGPAGRLLDRAAELARRAARSPRGA